MVSNRVCPKCGNHMLLLPIKSMTDGDILARFASKDNVYVGFFCRCSEHAQYIHRVNSVEDYKKLGREEFSEDDRRFSF